MKENDRHIVLTELLNNIHHDGSRGAATFACEAVEYVFDVQESDIDKLMEQNENLKDDLKTAHLALKALEESPELKLQSNKLNAIEAVVIGGVRYVPEDTQHDWKCVSAGVYYSLYECQKCKNSWMESIDNPDTIPPVLGCDS